MSGFKAVLLLLAAFVLCVNGQNALCFDREKTEPVIYGLVGSNSKRAVFDARVLLYKYKSLQGKCKAEVPEGTENRKGQIGLCMLKELGVLNGTEELDFEKFKVDTLSVVITKKPEVEALLDQCWAVVPEKGSKIGKFFECYKTKMDQVCPEDSKTWMKCDLP